MSEWNYLEWVEKAGIEHLREQLARGDFLTAQAQNLFTVLLVGIGGAMPFAIKLAEPGAGTRLIWGAAVTLAALFVVAAHLMYRCIMSRPTMPLYSHPRNIYRPDLQLSADEVRRYALDEIQARIKFTYERNAAVAQWLDLCRYGTLAAPLWFVLGAMVGPAIAG